MLRTAWVPKQMCTKYASLPYVNHFIRVRGAEIPTQKDGHVEFFDSFPDWLDGQSFLWLFVAPYFNDVFLFYPKNNDNNRKMIIYALKFRHVNHLHL